MAPEERSEAAVLEGAGRAGLRRGKKNVSQPVLGTRPPVEQCQDGGHCLLKHCSNRFRAAFEARDKCRVPRAEADGIGNCLGVGVDVLRIA